MGDAAVAAWRAAFSGALRSFDALSELGARVDATDDRHAPDPALVREVLLAAAGAAIATAALRSLSESMAGIRQGGDAASDDGSPSGVEDVT